MSDPERAPLTGFRVAVTSARRADELCTLLRRRGFLLTVLASAVIQGSHAAYYTLAALHWRAPWLGTSAR